MIKKNMKKALLVIMILIFTISVLGCSSGDKSSGNNNQSSTGAKIDTMKRIKDNNQIIWGTNAAFPPFEMREGDKVIGIDAEIAARIAEKLGVELVVEDMEFDSLMAALNSGKIDFIAAGFTVKPDRAEQVLFTDKYFKAVQVIIVHKDNEEIKEVDDLKGKKIGVQNGTTGDDVAEEIEGAEISRYNNAIEAVLDLKNGNIDAVIVDNLPAQILAQENPDIKILDAKPAEDEEYALAVRKGDTELQQIINEVLKEMKESGEIESLVNKYSIGE